MSKGIGRIGDVLTDGDVIAVGSGNVFANGIAVSRHGDATTGHGCFPATTMIATSSTVFINGIAVIQQGDFNVLHVCTLPPFPTDSGSVVIGSTNVFIG